jgi:hypothetical protein
MAKYRQILNELTRKPGEVWQTDSGSWSGKRTDGTSYGGMKSKEKAQAWVKGAEPDKKDEPEDKPKGKPEDESKPKDKEAEADELKAKLVNDKKVSQIMDFESRITDLKVRAEVELEGKERDKQIKELEHVREGITKLEGSFQDRAALLQAVGHLYGSRDNAGMGKNNLGMGDRDQLNRNKETLIAGYDDAIPEKVEKYVRSVRPHKVPEKFVEDSFNALPEALQSALKRKGKVGDAGKGKHFLGYKAVGEDGKEYTTSDRDDPNIQRGKDGKPEPVRGNTGTTERAKVVWRIYLEQGGIDAYTGMPLDLESMDLEHVVGFQNTDKNDPPTEEEYLNREHEANQVLCSSRANQQKSDKSMQDFYKENVDPLNDKTEDDFRALEKGYEQVNEIATVTEQTALTLQGDIQYKLKGGGVTNNPDDPNVDRSATGTPKVADATLGEKVTPEILENHFKREDDSFTSIKESLVGKSGGVTDPSDIKKIKSLKSKIGRKTLQAMGLPRGTTDPSGRRTNPIFSSDKDYRNFAMKMAAKPYNERQQYKDSWKEAMAVVGTESVRKMAQEKTTSQKQVFDLYIRGDIDGLQKLGVVDSSNPAHKDIIAKLKTRGNLMESSEEGYQSLEGLISRRYLV